MMVFGWLSVVTFLLVSTLEWIQRWAHGLHPIARWKGFSCGGPKPP